MRFDKLVLLLTLAGGFAFTTACGDSTKEDSESGDDDDATGDDDDNGNAGDDDDASPGDDDDDTYTPSYADTAQGLALYTGGGTLSGGNYVGSESIAVIGLPTQALLCEWTWSATGVPSGVAAPCKDYDGNACDFTLDVTLGNDGAQTGGDCVSLFGSTLGADGGGPYPYGYISDYQYNGGGYGPWMLYYFADYSNWYIVTPYTSYDSGSGMWEYDWPIGYVNYVP